MQPPMAKLSTAVKNIKHQHNAEQIEKEKKKKKKEKPFTEEMHFNW